MTQDNIVVIDFDIKSDLLDVMYFNELQKTAFEIVFQYDWSIGETYQRNERFE